MLIKFNFKNFKSFRNQNCIDMEATSIKEHEYNTVLMNDKRYLKIAAIYGANASGKTNALEAFEYMRKKLLQNVDADLYHLSEDDYYNFCFDQKAREEPIVLEVTISAKNKKIYRYGFEIKRNIIASEWLDVIDKEDIPIFERNKSVVAFNESYQDKVTKTRYDVDSKSLFLSLYRKIEKENDDFKNVYNWFLNSYYLDLGNPNFENRIRRLISGKILDNDESQKRLVKFIKAFDLGIDDIKFEVKDTKNINNIIEQKVDIKAIHKDESGKKIELPFYLESKGTLKMFYLYSFIVDALGFGNTLFIDELDAELHPLLTRYIIKLFHDKDINKGDSQLIYTTHDTTNLNKETFRRDEICFTDKNKYGVSELYSLADYKIDNNKVRNDATYNKDYLTGRYGAIPIFKDFDLDIDEK